MSTSDGQRPAEGRREAAESHANEINSSSQSDDYYAAALAACEGAQSALDAAYLLDDDSVRLTACADAYRRRAEAWDQLAEALPPGMPLPFVTALFLASMSDATRAEDYRQWADERRAAEAGDVR